MPPLKSYAIWVDGKLFDGKVSYNDQPAPGEISIELTNSVVPRGSIPSQIRTAKRDFFVRLLRRDMTHLVIDTENPAAIARAMGIDRGPKKAARTAKS